MVFCAFMTTNGVAVSRSSNTPTTMRQGTTSQRVRTTTVTPRKTVRIATPQTKTVSRTATADTTTPRNSNQSARGTVVARTATNETRTGAEYEQCKNAYFTCMDQFCQLKNDDYRRCSCSDRITSLQSAKDSLVRASEQLNAFNENLDIVDKTAAQATAMNTASDGELAMSKDTSASKALLNAIMNSIRGSDSRVENNKLSDLNSVDFSFDTANSFGTDTTGQAIASRNGTALYSAVYPGCRDAVKSSCNTASLQRAVNAYLMAIEQDCNTVQTAITNKQKETHAAIRESSAMLDLARAENHKSHNSDDMATCLNNVESAILSEEVCGANYHKCLDNGEYIDVSTGAPIAGVADFYKLGKMLTFNSERSNADQKLAQNPNNKTFVNNFEKRVKQFAEPALDKCYDDSKTVWNDYLNKAMLDIYYAQQAKVSEIQQGCFDFVSACYMNGSTAMTAAMQGLVAAQTTTLNPNILKINKSLCSDYIESCNNMFDGGIVEKYIDNRHDTDSLTACRAVVQQCFDNYGGLNYENFYYPSSGLFTKGRAPDWFALYECTDANCTTHTYKSECAKQLAAIDACSDPEMVEQAFGGFNYYPNANNNYSKYAYNNQNRLLRGSGVATEVYNQIIDILQTGCSNLDGKFMNVQNLAIYSTNYNSSNFCQETFTTSASRYYYLYSPYSIGKQTRTYGFSRDAFSRLSDGSATLSALGADSAFPVSYLSVPRTWVTTDHHENMCPRDYEKNIDIQSWGACLCWENGGRRSNNGTSTRCTPSFSVKPLTTYDVGSTIQQTTTYGLNNSCSSTDFIISATESTNDDVETATGGFELWPYTTDTGQEKIPTEQDWCTANVNNQNQVCPFGVNLDSDNNCNDCPYDWVVKNSSASDTAKRCCPSDYSLSGETCTKTNYPTISARKISSVIMGSNFPSGN